MEQLFSFLGGGFLTLLTLIVSAAIQQRGEHERWTRDARRVAYSEFLAAVDRANRAAVMCLWAQSEVEEKAVIDDVYSAKSGMMLAYREFQDESGKVRLLGSQPIVLLADEIEELLYDLQLRARGFPTFRDERDDSDDALQDFTRRFLEQGREDLRL